MAGVTVVLKYEEQSIVPCLVVNAAPDMAVAHQQMNISLTTISIPRRQLSALHLTVAAGEAVTLKAPKNNVKI